MGRARVYVLSINFLSVLSLQRVFVFLNNHTHVCSLCTDLQPPHLISDNVGQRRQPVIISSSSSSLFSLLARRLLRLLRRKLDNSKSLLQSKFSWEGRSVDNGSSPVNLTIFHSVLVNRRFMLERSSNNYGLPKLISLNVSNEISDIGVLQGD
ncbi:hypothetical protein K1719_000909 [Acacia pycnantha]|nr:hypothetical protein K1719_000909 [Acacia pycnantha]